MRKARLPELEHSRADLMFDEGLIQSLCLLCGYTVVV